MCTVVQFCTLSDGTDPLLCIARNSCMLMAAMAADGRGHWCHPARAPVALGGVRGTVTGGRLQCETAVLHMPSRRRRSGDRGSSSLTLLHPSLLHPSSSHVDHACSLACLHQCPPQVRVCTVCTCVWVLYCADVRSSAFVCTCVRRVSRSHVVEAVSGFNSAMLRLPTHTASDCAPYICVCAHLSTCDVMA